MTVRRLPVIGLFFLFINLAFSQSGLPSLSPSLQHTLDSIVEADKIPGATLAAVLPDGRLISLAAGLEDVELQRPMLPGTQMLTGSTGKTFVSAVALQLVAEGKIGLDDQVAGYFAGSADDWFYQLPNARDLTVRSLMNHSSGLPRYIFQEQWLAAMKADPLRTWTPRESLSVLAGLPPLHPVGEGWGYSDSNYLLLGLIIEKVTGNTFYQEAERRLLQPFKLTHTYPSTQPELPGLAPGYIGDENFLGLPRKTVEGGRYAMNPQFEWCGGGYVTNVEDLARWMKSLHGGQVLTPDTYAELIQAIDFRTGRPADAGYGLGTFVWQAPLGTFLGHAGIMPGYLTQIEYSKQHGFSVALQSNTDQGLGRGRHGYVQRFAQLIVEYLAGR